MKMKKIITLIAVFAMLVSILCGCGNETTDPTTGATQATQATEKTYNVSFIDQNNNPVGGVVVMWSFEDGNTQLAITAEDGKLYYKSTSTPSIEISSVPAGYTAEQKNHVFTDGTDLTIVLICDDAGSSTITYTVTVVDTEGNPVPGAVIQICDEENCKLPMTTDENGVASAQYEESEYHVTLNTLPEGYTSEETEFYFNGATELTIVVAAEGE